MRNFAMITMIALAIGASGCSRSGDALRVNTQPPPQPLPSTPSGSFETSELQPTETQPGLNDPGQQQAPSIVDSPTTDGTTEVAAVDPAVSNRKITHDAMAGSWNVNSDSADCRLILSFTKWSGGYRAATLRCSSAELASVSAWDVKNNKVVLVDTNGNQIADISAVGEEAYAGTLAGGKPINFSR